MNPVSKRQGKAWRKMHRRKLEAALRFVLTLGAVVPVCVTGSVSIATVRSEPPAIDRVDDIRSKLMKAEKDIDSAPRERLAQYWYNWPNWGNWNGWVPRRAARWRWPGR